MFQINSFTAPISFPIEFAFGWPIFSFFGFYNLWTKTDGEVSFSDLSSTELLLLTIFLPLAVKFTGLFTLVLLTKI